MTGPSPLVRTLLIYGICLPLAVLLGYLLATPLELTSLEVVGVVALVLASPLILRWHHLWLIACWNAPMVCPFLPGHPPFWLFLAAVSFGICILQYCVNRKFKFLRVPSVGRPLIFLTVVVLITAKLTGGIGMGSLGSQTMGGRRYVVLLGAIVGYFAMTGRPIRRGRELLYVGLFFLVAATAAVGELAPYLGPASRPIFWVFPTTQTAVHSMQSIADATTPMISRLSALTQACTAVYFFMLARYGIRGIFTWQQPGRLLFFSGLAVAALLGGYRGTLVMFMLTFAALFYLEGLWRSRMLPSFILMGVLVCALVVAYTDRLPLSIQRSLSVLPLDVDPLAKSSAESSSDWRLKIWQDVLPEIPPHLILGKGLGINANELNRLNVAAGFQSVDSSSEGSEMAGDYHNGPLSLIIPFGIFGVIGFVWFLAAVLRMLYRNYRFGNPAQLNINRFLLVYFVCKIIFFFCVFGGFYGDLAIFTGLAGLSVSLNGGMARRVVAPERAPASKAGIAPLKLRPALHRPARA